MCKSSLRKSFSTEYVGARVANACVNIKINIYRETKTNVKLEFLGCAFPIDRAVKQGDALSPKLFSAVLEQVFRKLEWDHLRLDVYGLRLNHLRFDDDLSSHTGGK
ncbi:hypothetical protein EVAR_94390_1 [Eumeta japonica]|uniref:Reverse transcriptase domain-containing protein n=1 Tax=Eumeta variegata TaxID=151549 RepID=A0A4C1TQ10_EUMVA|nr:hypothetical protein EVAR_94390_1 [Eumeta japonica]